MSVTPSAAVDPELYFRLEGERTLLAPDRTHRDGGLGAIGSALVAAGALDHEVATTIAEDYATAGQLRPGGSGMMFPGFRPPRPPPVTAPVAPIVARCTRDESQADGTIPYAVLGDTSTQLAVTYNGSQDWQTVAQRFPNPAGFPPSLQMTDDTGRSLPAQFEGGGGSDGWVGRFTTSAPLSQHTRWLELGGMRITLTRVDPPPVTIEQLPQTSTAADFLRHRIAADGNVPPPDADPVIAALVAIGALDPDDPVLDELRAIAGSAQFPPGISPAMMRHLAARHARAMSFGGGAAAPPAVPVPEPWRSLRMSVPRRGPDGTIPLGVAIPLLEGTAAVLFALTSGEDSFSIDTSEVGGKPHGHFGSQLVDPAPTFAWWAQDDRGNTYRGSWGGWGGSETERRGNVVFAPPLDPAARLLRLLPTVRTCRAVVEITLPEWGELA